MKHWLGKDMIKPFFFPSFYLVSPSPGLVTVIPHVFNHLCFFSAWKDGTEGFYEALVGWRIALVYCYLFLSSCVSSWPLLTHSHPVFVFICIQEQRKKCCSRDGRVRDKEAAGVYSCGFLHCSKA